MGACTSKPATKEDRVPPPAVHEKQQRSANGSGVADGDQTAAPTAAPAAPRETAATPAYLEIEAKPDEEVVNLAVVKDGVAILQNSVGKTNFKGLADFEDAERQEANKSILACFGCNPQQGNTEHRFDNITNLLAGIFSMPVALVVFLDSAFAYIRAGVGMSQAEGATSRGLSFCTWTLVTLKPEVQVITDTLRDGRFKTHPYVVGLPHLRFYAGAPLISSRGHRLGSLCLCDYTPRAFDAECCNILCNFAEIVVRDAERYAAEDGAAALDPLSSGLSAGAPVRELGAGDAMTTVALVKTREPGWPLLFVSEGFADATGVGQEAAGRGFWELFWEPGSHSSGVHGGGQAFAQRVQHGASFVVEVAGGRIASDSTCLVRFRPAALEALDHKQVHVNINIPGPVRKAVDQDPAAYYFATVQRVSCGSGCSVGSVAAHDPQQDVPFDDVRLGGLLGKGSFGSVFIGLAAGTPCAVKVIEHRSQPDRDASAAREELEATLGMELDHPHIVRTLKFATRRRAGAAAVLRPGHGSAGSGRPNSAIMQPPTPLGSGVGNSALSVRGAGGSRFSLDMGEPRSKGRMETWIVLELCDLGSLQAAIDEGCFRQSGNIFEGAPDVARILDIVMQIASAMDYLHAKGLLHSDLTANNILLQSVGGPPLDLTGAFEAAELELAAVGDGDEQSAAFVAKVSDFGLSRAAATESAMSTNTIGTVTHMPPELLRDGQLSKAVDVYAFGVLLWEMYVGERPWAGMRPVTIILKKTQDKARLAWPPGTPPAYQELGDMCMSTDPKARPTFPQIRQRLADLRRAAQDSRLAPTGGFSQYHGWQRAFEGNAAREEAV